MSFSLHGISASKGIAIGRVSVLERSQFEVNEYVIEPGDIAREVERFNEAVRLAKTHVERLREQLPSALEEQAGAFIEVHMLMLQDAAIASAPAEIIEANGCNAEWALKLQRDTLVAAFDAIDDPYLRARRDDVDHAAARIQWALKEGLGGAKVDDSARHAGRIVCADDLTPADTVLMQHQGILAFVTEYGGPNSHTAILARSLRIPAVVGLHAGRKYLRDGDNVVVDGRLGVILVEPDASARAFYEQRQREIAAHHAARRRLLKEPAVTMDGERVTLQANVELERDATSARAFNADGVGLYRTEMMFMNRSEPPGEEEQFEAYKQVISTMKGAPVTIRTLDLGADKQVDGMRPGAPEAANPALGLRAVRLCLREPQLFKTQLRAILRASAFGRVRMMVPMVAVQDELVQVRHFLAQCHAELDASGIKYDSNMPVGAMIEVPAAAVCADLFARQADFLSIGTNDLIQYTIAIDRIDDEVSYLYDPVHPAVLRLIQTVIRAGHHTGIPVAMCGEMAGDARYTRLLLGLGLREFSVHPGALLEVKQMVVESHAGNLRRLTQRIMRAHRPSTRQSLLKELNDS